MWGSEFRMKTRGWVSWGAFSWRSGIVMATYLTWKVLSQDRTLIPVAGAGWSAFLQGPKKRVEAIYWTLSYELGEFYGFFVCSFVFLWNIKASWQTVTWVLPCLCCRSEMLDETDVSQLKVTLLMINMQALTQHLCVTNRCPVYHITLLPLNQRALDGKEMITGRWNCFYPHPSVLWEPVHMCKHMSHQWWLQPFASLTPNM